MLIKIEFLLCVLFLLILQVKPVVGQTSYTIPAEITYLNGLDQIYQSVKPGDTLRFIAGSKNYLLIKNFQGSAEKPIVMINSGGPIIIDTDFYYGIAIHNCQYIKFTGTGDPNQTYGFQVKRVANGAGMGIGELSSDFEIDHVSIENCLIGGLYAKTDPDCTLSSVRSNFTQKNTVIHDNFISNAGNEGMYIGSTKYDGQTVQCNGKDTVLLPSLLDGVRVYNNIVKYAGWDGIQVSSAYKDCKIYNNTVLFDSQAESNAQMSGIMIGGGTKCDCFNNFISQGKGDGIESHGLGGSRIFNNIILDAGRSYLPADPTQMKYGIYISDNDSSIYIENNNIINPKSDGIRFANVSGNINVIASNVIINPGNFDLYQNGNTWSKGIDSYVMRPDPGFVLTLQNNYLSRNADSVKFVSTAFLAPADFKLLAGSPLIDRADIDKNINFDFEGLPRPSGIKSDIGAFEFQMTSTPKVQVISGGGAYCEGGTGVAIKLRGSENGVNYQLRLDGVKFGSVVAGTGSAISFGLQTAVGVYTATAINVATSSVKAMYGSVTVTKIALPVVSAIQGNNTLCGLSTTILTNSTAGGVWSSSSPTIATVTTTGIVKGIVAGTTTIKYTVTNGNGCSNNTSMVVTVNAAPKQYSITGGGGYCIGGNGVVVGLSGSQADINYQLNINGTYTGNSVPGTGAAISFGLQKTEGNYTVNATNANTNCSNIMKGGVSVTINALPEIPAEIGGDNSVCVGSTTMLTETTTGGVWSSLTPTIASVNTSGVVTGKVKGTATIKYTVTNGSKCTNSISTSITVNGKVSQPASFTSSTTKVYQGQTDVAYEVPFVEGVTYNWSYSGSGATISGTDNSILISYLPTATSGTLSVTASSICGTSTPRSLNITVVKKKDGALPMNSTEQAASDYTNLQTTLPAASLNNLNIYPNPSYGMTTFEFEIDKDAHVMIEIFSVNGKSVARIFDADVEAGIEQSLHFQQSLPTGVYSCVMRWGGRKITRKLIVKQ